MKTQDASKLFRVIAYVREHPGTNAETIEIAAARRGESLSMILLYAINTGWLREVEDRLYFYAHVEEFAVQGATA